MSIESVLDIVRKRGLKFILDEKGITAINGGTKEDRSPALFNALKLYRQPIIDLIKARDERIKDLIHPSSFIPAPKPPQPGDERVVVLTDGRDSAIEKVLSKHGKGEHASALSSIRIQSKYNRDKNLAIEMMEVHRETGRKEWRRFFWRRSHTETCAATEEGQVNPPES
jgi:hypothetical protein